MCLLQRSHRRHWSAILNSAVKSDPVLVRVQDEKQTEAERKEIGRQKRRESEMWRVRGGRSCGVQPLVELSALSDRHATTDNSSLPPQDYVSSSSLLTSNHVTPGPIQHWVREGCCSDAHTHLWKINPKDCYQSLMSWLYFFLSLIRNQCLLAAPHHLLQIFSLYLNIYLQFCTKIGSGVS